MSLSSWESREKVVPQKANLTQKGVTGKIQRRTLKEVLAAALS